MDSKHSSRYSYSCMLKDKQSILDPAFVRDVAIFVGIPLVLYVVVVFVMTLF